MKKYILIIFSLFLIVLSCSIATVQDEPIIEKQITYKNLPNDDSVDYLVVQTNERVNFEQVGITEDATFSIAPLLTNGLTINKRTGDISGRATNVAIAKTTYEVTARSTITGDKITKNISIWVYDDIRIDYPNFIKSTNALANDTLVVEANKRVDFEQTGITSDATFSNYPAFPAGLVLNTTNGKITGTATVATAKTNYRVTAKIGSATITKDINIRVYGDIVYTGFNHATNDTLVVKQGASVNLTQTGITNSGDIKDFTFSISSSLPAGLNFDTNTGNITGTPSGIVRKTSYTVTATLRSDDSKTVSKTIYIRVYGDISYPGITGDYLVLAKVSAANVTSYISYAQETLSDEVTFTISPSLPNVDHKGLSIGTTGNIKGYPSVASNMTEYTITATLATGETVTKKLNIWIYDTSTSVNTVITGGLTYTEIVGGGTKHINIASGTTSIPANAFPSQDITSVFIPDSVTYIGSKAFYNNQLTSVTIPNSITQISAFAGTAGAVISEAFTSNENLKTVTLSSGLYVWEMYDFSSYFGSQVETYQTPEGTRLNP